MENGGSQNQDIIDAFITERDVYITGDMVRTRSNDATGKMSFNQRVELQEYYNNKKPLKPRISNFTSFAPK